MITIQTLSLSFFLSLRLPDLNILLCTCVTLRKTILWPTNIKYRFKIIPKINISPAHLNQGQSSMEFPLLADSFACIHSNPEILTPVCQGSKTLYLNRRTYRRSARRWNTCRSNILITFLYLFAFDCLCQMRSQFTRSYILM